MTPNALALSIAVPFVAWRLYSRSRRMIGRQESKLWRHWTAAILFPLLLATLTALMPGAALSPIGLLGGAAVGAGLGVWGLSLTRFEKTDEGAFFTPNPYLGTALVALFAVRIGYRFIQMAGADGPPRDPMAGFGQSPLTLLVFGLLAGYYATYALGLLRWRLKP